MQVGGFQRLPTQPRSLLLKVLREARLLLHLRAEEWQFQQLRFFGYELVLRRCLPGGVDGAVACLARE